MLSFQSTVTVLCLEASQLLSHAFTAAVIWASQSLSSVLCFTSAAHHALFPASQPICVLNNSMFQSELPTPGRECAAD